MMRSTFICTVYLTDNYTLYIILACARMIYGSLGWRNALTYEAATPNTAPDVLFYLTDVGDKATTSLRELF